MLLNISIDILHNFDSENEVDEINALISQQIQALRTI